MKYPYKERIVEIIESARFCGLFLRPESGPTEYPLDISDPPCRADFCYRIRPKGTLFVEDDDGARAVNNLVKYWEWCLKHPETAPVFLVHIVERSSPAQLGHCKFLSDRMTDAMPLRFHYRMIEIEAWSLPHETWLSAFASTVAEIAAMTQPNATM